MSISVLILVERGHRPEIRTVSDNVEHIGGIVKYVLTGPGIIAADLPDAASTSQVAKIPGVQAVREEQQLKSVQPRSKRRGSRKPQAE